jgi:hypothetical protein
MPGELDHRISTGPDMLDNIGFQHIVAHERIWGLLGRKVVAVGALQIAARPYGFSQDLKRAVLHKPKYRGRTTLNQRQQKRCHCFSH